MKLEIKSKDKHYELDEKNNNVTLTEEGVHKVEDQLGIDNLFDEEYIIDAGNTGDAFGIPTFIAGSPRMVGLRVGASF